MIEVSCESIDYSPDQIQQSLTVTNKGQIQILYKVRTNNIKAIDARPNTGVIPPGASSKISIKRSQNITENVKLQFTYLQCQQNISKQNKDSFKQAWAKYQKNQHSKTFPIRIVADTLRKQGEKINSAISNSSQSDPSMFQSVRVSRSSKTQEQGNQEIKQRQSVPQQFKKQKSQQNWNKQLAQKIEQQRNTNMNMQKRINQKQLQAKKNSQYNQQLKLDKYLTNQSCKKSHFSPITFFVVAILFFLFGYYLGLSNSQSDMSTQA